MKIRLTLLTVNDDLIKDFMVKAEYKQKKQSQSK